MKSSSRRKATKWELYFYYLQMLIGIARGFLIVPFYLIYIDKILYGAWLATGNILGWIQLFDPGTGAVLKQKISQEVGKNDKHTLGLYIGSGWLISFFITILVLATGLLIANSLGPILKLNLIESQIKELEQAFRLATLGVSCSVFSFSVIAINKGFLKAQISNIITLSSNIIGLTVNLFLLFNGFRLLAIAWGLFFNSVLTLIGNILLQIVIIRANKLKIKLQWEFFKSFSKLFSYTFFAKIGVVLVEKSDLIIISRFIGQEAVTAFELTRRPIRIAFDLANKASVALMPALSNLYGTDDKQKVKQVLTKVVNYLLILTVLVSILFILFNKSLISIWLNSPDIFIGSTLNVLLVFAILIRSMFYNFSNFAFSLGNIKGNSMILVAKSGIYVVGLFLLVDRFGLLGVILSMLIAVLAAEAWYYPITLKKLLNIQKFTFFRMSLFVPILLLIISVLFKDVVYIENGVKLLLYSSLISFTYFIIVLFSNNILKEDLKKVIKKFK